MASTDDISALLQRVARQDRAAFAEVYAATSAKLYGIILRILRRRDIADEVLQEVYVKIWERSADFRPERASPIAWMAAIARNRALDEARRKLPVSIEDHPEVQDFPSDAETGLAAVMRGEDSKRLADCLARLEADRRQMVVLAYCEGLSREELAATYDQPVNTIKTWLRRSLAQLKGCLSS
ncbi:sigma-70 family RNA polymerase sigma factor [Hyphomicrobium sp. ghe19]|uniref:sigma-70 family RNA polymerase sigma factor n=1 Tax=Hyphomicrobium sp. ghe19 TaxID=2682968 RepID=UPI0013676848|nr:ECF RNA polymerase sigma factor SigK [Hyphomicrobium sp. ghe19]